MLYSLPIASYGDLAALGTASWEGEDKVNNLGVVLVRECTSQNDGKFRRGGGTVVKAVFV